MENKLSLGWKLSYHDTNTIDVLEAHHSNFVNGIPFFGTGRMK